MPGRKKPIQGKPLWRVGLQQGQFVVLLYCRAEKGRVLWIPSYWSLTFSFVKNSEILYPTIIFWAFNQEHNYPTSQETVVVICHMQLIEIIWIFFHTTAHSTEIPWQQLGKYHKDSLISSHEFFFVLLKSDYLSHSHILSREITCFMTVLFEMERELFKGMKMNLYTETSIRSLTMSMLHSYLSNVYLYMILIDIM